MKLDRMLGILTILLQQDQVTAPQLADKFEVSRRTIGRDIDTLCLAGIPIITRQGGGGGISIADGFKLDKSILTSEELSSIISAIKGIASVAESSQMEHTLDKLTSGKDAVMSLREPIVIDLASHYKGDLSPKIEQIKKAILQNKLIEFEYYYEKGKVFRQIEPYYVIFQWSAWYVFGYCTHRQDWRLFKLTRLWNLRISDQTFSYRTIPPERQDFNAIYHDKNKLVALFDPSVKYQLIETYGLNCYSETEEGKLRLEIGYSNRDYYISWLLGFGDKVKVIEPSDMAEDLRQIAQNISNLYQ